jgi:hypothetical protein
MKKMTTTIEHSVELTPEAPDVVRWKEQFLKNASDEWLITVAFGRSTNDAPQYAARLMLQERGYGHELTSEMGSKVYAKREEVLVKLAKLVLWFDWLDVVGDDVLSKHGADGPYFEREELLSDVIQYTHLLDRCMDECGGY